MKKFFASAIISFVLLFAGLCLAIIPSAFMNILCYFAGTTCIILSAVKFLTAYKKNNMYIQVPFCVMLLMLGFVLVLLQAQIINILPLIVGVCFLVYGLTKLNTANAFKNISSEIYKKLLISALVGIAMSLLIIILSNFIGEIIYRLIGVLLIYNSAENIFSKIISSKKPKENVTPKKKDAIEAEVTDEE